MKKTAHIISHTHWDREWYLDSKYTNEWLIPFFDNLYYIMEKEKSYIFVLDGQLSMIDDYFEQLEKQGQQVYPYRERLKKYTAEKRLILGPYFLQPDWQLVSEESLVRNILYGHKMAEELGGSQKIGWLLDNFGQISQAAQIHKECGIDSVFVWRGVEMPIDNLSTEFIWKSPDGSKVFAMYMINSYRNAMRLAPNEDILKIRLDDEIKKLSFFNKTSHVLLMNGYDQDLEPDDVSPLIQSGKYDTDEYSLVQSTPQQFVDAVLAEKPEMPTLTGALYSGRFGSVFPGVMSSRMYLKLQNNTSQNLIEHYLEPISTLCWLYGQEYEQTGIGQLWKILLKNHPHDSICGVSIDPVHRDMEKRHETFQSLAQGMLRNRLDALCALIDTQKSSGLVVFNTSCTSRSGILQTSEGYVLAKNIPAMGYQILESQTPVNPCKIEGNSLSNGLIEISLHDDGSFDLKYLSTGKTYENQCYYVDMGDAGDLYNYSYPDNDREYSSKNNKAKITVLESGPVIAKLKVDTVMEVPKETCKEERGTELISLPITTFITIEADSEIVKIKTMLKNTAKNHVLKAMFPTDIETDFSYAGSHFDVVKRPIHTDDFDEDSLPDHIKAVLVGAREPKANSFYLQHRFVDINDGNEGIAILNNGLPEFEIIKDKNTIAVTLFRSVDVIAGHINTRLGDAGPNMLTPDGQCLREMSFELAIYPHSGDTYSGKVTRAADFYNNPLMLVETGIHEGQLPCRKSFIDIQDVKDSIKVTAIKKSENGNFLVVRFYNSSSEETTATIDVGIPVKKALFVELLENPKDTISISDNKVVIDVPAKKIITIAFEPEVVHIDVDAGNCTSLVAFNDDADFSAFESAALVSQKDLDKENKRRKELPPDEILTRRSYLEAEISYILAKNQFEEQKIHKLGYQLNDARVQRRLHDYIGIYKK